MENLKRKIDELVGESNAIGLTEEEMSKRIDSLSKLISATSTSELEKEKLKLERSKLEFEYSKLEMERSKLEAETKRLKTIPKAVIFTGAIALAQVGIIVLAERTDIISSSAKSLINKIKL